MMSDTNINLLIKILTDSASAKENNLFNAWLDETKSNRLYYQEIRILWERTKETYNNVEFDEAAAKEKIRSRIQQLQPRARVLKKRFVISVAASIILLLGLALTAIYLLKPGENNYLVYASNDSVREILLPDSSRIWLNENSKLLAPRVFSHNQRKVTLEGEAYFEITHDENKPFKVRAGNTIIKVLGTTFDVETEKGTNDVSVVVNSGKVAFYRVNSLHDNYILTQGTKGQFIASDQRIIISGNKNQNYLSWKTGTLTFYDTPLDEVCLILSDHYKRKITTNLVDSGLFLTGSFQNETLDDILKTIELTLDVEATVSEEAILIHN
jgi:transmembrane sensor